jgi:hypothetical protein
MLGLRIPTDADSLSSLGVLRLTASGLSDAIGGGLLEDALIGDVDGAGCTFTPDEYRAAVRSARRREVAADECR